MCIWNTDFEEIYFTKAKVSGRELKIEKPSFVLSLHQRRRGRREKYNSSDSSISSNSKCSAQSYIIIMCTKKESKRIHQNEEYRGYIYVMLSIALK